MCLQERVSNKTKLLTGRFVAARHNKFEEIIDKF